MFGGRLPIVGGLGLELGAQPPGLAGGAAQPPFGALGPVGGPGQRERSLGGALRFGIREPLLAPVAGELGELVHGGSFPCPSGGGLVAVAFTVTDRGGRSPYVAAHRPRTGGAQDYAGQ